MRTILLFFVSVTSAISLAQEVSKNVIVEHFTNTYCSICASRNPGFYANLNNHPEVLHVAYHPSSPYSACPLNQHNVNENDNRTMYYGIFGGTPRLVVQGAVIPAGDDYSSSMIFDPFENQTTPFEVTPSIDQNITLDSIVVDVNISKVSASSLDSLNLYVILVEETLNFNANNGENVHHDVFRKSLVGEHPIKIELPELVGQDTTITYRIQFNSEWNGSELKSIALLQNDQKEVEQVGESDLLDFTANTEGNDEIFDLFIYPNPVKSGYSNLNIYSNKKCFSSIQFYNNIGELVYEKTDIQSNSKSISTESLKPGVYHMNVDFENYSIRRKLIVE